MVACFPNNVVFSFSFFVSHALGMPSCGRLPLDSGVIPKGNHRAHRERRVVPYSPEQFFAVVADVKNYRKFVPFCVDSRVVRVIDENTMEADMSVGFKVWQ